MIKVEVLEDFTLKDFGELRNIERGTTKEEKGKLFKYDKFECSEDMCEYLTGKNPLKRPVVKVIEVTPEIIPIPNAKSEEVEIIPIPNAKIEDVKIMPVKSTKKKRVSKK